MVNLLDLSDAQNQVQTVNLVIDGKANTLRVQFRRLVTTNRWYMTITNAITGVDYVTFVPLIASAFEDVNDLLEQFEYFGLGSIIVTNRGNVAYDPVGPNINDWYVCWGDRITEDDFLTCTNGDQILYWT